MRSRRPRHKFTTIYQHLIKHQSRRGKENLGIRSKRRERHLWRRRFRSPMKRQAFTKQKKALRSRNSGRRLKRFSSLPPDSYRLKSSSALPTNPRPRATKYKKHSTRPRVREADSSKTNRNVLLLWNRTPSCSSLLARLRTLRQSKY